MKRFIFSLFIIAPILLAVESEEEKIKVVAKGQEKANEQMNATRNDPAGFTETIDLTEKQKRYTSLEEILEQESGVRVRRYGGLGSYSTLSIRGSNANQVQFYIDGIPVQNNSGGEVNLFDLPFDTIEKIEIYKSGFSPGLTSSAIGGSINLITKKGKKKKVSRIRIAGGSFRTYKINAGHSNYYQDLDYTFYVQKEKSDGNLKFRNDNGTPVLNTYDDYDTRRKNAWFDRYNFTTNLSYKAGKTNYHFLNDFNYRFQGIPGPGNNQTEKVKRKYLRNTTAIGSKSKGILWPWLNLDTRAFYTGARDELFDPKTELSSGPEDARVQQQNYGIHLIPQIYLLNYHQIIRVLLASERETFQREQMDSLHNTTNKIPKKFRNHNVIQVQDEIRFWNKRLRLIPAIQMEEYVGRFNEDPFEKSLTEIFEKNKAVNRFTNPRFGFLLVPYLTDVLRISLKANISRETRIANFTELFGERGSVLGNTSLEPEQSTSWDVGPIFLWATKYFHSKTVFTYFHKSIVDMILFIPNSQFTLKPENVDSANIRGMEIQEKLTFLDHWQWKTAYTYQKAINTSRAPSLNGKYLALRPLHELNSGISYRNKKFKIGGQATYIGASYKDRSNEYLNYEPGRWLYNSYFTYYFIDTKSEQKNTDFFKQVYLTIDIKNIQNKRAYDIVGYPLAGRSGYLSLSALF